MSYLQFDKTQLINLSYSLSKEIIRSNRSGAYANSTIIGCNTRKYHGMLVAPQPQIDNDNHVLLSGIDESIVHGEAIFNLGIHKYPGIYSPKGHKYLEDYTTEPIPKLAFRVGSVVLLKEILLVENTNRVMVRYTLSEADDAIALRLSPFLAFRNFHALSKANIHLNKKFEKVEGGIKLRPYPRYDHLFLQLNRNSEYVAVPDWYYNIEYIEEKERGYPYQEDLFVPGFFEIPLKKGQSVIIAVGTEIADPAQFDRQYSSEIKKRIPRDSFYNCLINAARQFVVSRGDRTEITAGFPWFGRWGRDTLIALPGISLALGETKTMKAVIDTLIRDMNGPLFPNVGEGQAQALNSVDAPMWFFWTLQQYANFSGKKKLIWKEYGKVMKTILEGYRKGTSYNIGMQENGLIYAGADGVALTWMDAVVNGIPVTPRTGFQVEINALWYNAISYSLELAEEAGDKEFIREWSGMPEKVKVSFLSTFWSDERGYLADYVDAQGMANWFVRPNQVIACSLPYTMLDEGMAKSMLEVVRQDLLTPRGLRTLSPKNPLYEGIYQGDQESRDKAYHQGTVWPWLWGHYAEATLKVFGNSKASGIKKQWEAFAGTMSEHGISTISEIYDGDPPHRPRGACSQAWSVAEVLRVHELLKAFPDA
jgi:predicted glycogen debranching enzyme